MLKNRAKNSTASMVLHFELVNPEDDEIRLNASCFHWSALTWLSVV
jgi:hypothetical protein